METGEHLSDAGEGHQGEQEDGVHKVQHSHMKCGGQVFPAGVECSPANLYPQGQVISTTTDHFYCIQYMT